MKNLCVFSAICLAFITTSFAENERHISLTLAVSLYSTKDRFPNYGFDYCWGATNSVEIAEGETAELISWDGDPQTGSVFAVGIKNNTEIDLRFPMLIIGYQMRGSVIAGPATIKFFRYLTTQTPTFATQTKGSLATVKITPSSYDVNKTLMLAPGTNQVFVTLESSTNLLNWSDATNGVYGSPDTARFFRMRQSTLHSQ